MTSPLLLPAYPPMVQGLHAAFVSHMRMDMPVSPYLDAGARGELEMLLDNGASPREIADELLFSTISGWAGMSDQRTAGVTVHSTFGIETLFRPMEKGNIDCGTRDEPRAGRKADAEAIARGIAHQHASANRYLEVRFPQGTPGLDTYFIIHAELNVYGLYLYAMHDNQAILRIPSLTFFESTMRYCLGKRALTPCFASGEVEPAIVNQLHKAGFHAMGQPLRKLRMHGQSAEPADYTLHDLGHLIHSSVQLSLFEQRAASLFYECATGVLKADSRLRQIWTLLSEDFGHLMNLEVGSADGRTFTEIMAKTRQMVFTIHGQETVDKLFDFYQSRLDKFFKTDAKRDPALRQEIEAFRKHLGNIRAGAIGRI